VEEAAPPPASRPADVSPLAAVIGIALLGGMLLIGVLIGREAGGDDESAPGAVVTVGRSTTDDGSTSTPPASGDDAATDTDGSGDAAILSEWPVGTDGFTVQLSTVPKDGATPESVDAAKQQAISDGAADAAVLDSDQYSTLPPGQYIIYSGVYTDRKSAEVAMKGLGDSFESAVVVEVAGASLPGADGLAPGAGGEEEILPEQERPEK
jgi:hypothetical protein